jgi:carbonic anhydrase
MRIMRTVLGLLMGLAVLVWPVTSPSRADLPQQSPIDIGHSQLERVELPALEFDYETSPLHLTYVRKDTDQPNGCALRHHEETVEVAPEHGGARLHVGDVTYELVNVHWHTPSEHRVDRRSFPVEQHMVHRSPDGRLLVVGVMWRVGRANAQLDRIFSSLPAECEPAREIVDFDLEQLVPEDSRSFRYRGSLTTSPYSEGVSWIVLARPMMASAEQLGRLQAMFPEGNARDIQPVNDRIIQTER